MTIAGDMNVQRSLSHLLPTVNIPSLMVTSKQENFVREEEFHRKQVRDDLEAAKTSVDVVT